MRFIPRVKIAVGSLGGVQLIIGPNGAVVFVVLIEPRFGRFGPFLISRPYDGRRVFKVDSSRIIRHSSASAFEIERPLEILSRLHLGTHGRFELALQRLTRRTAHIASYGAFLEM